MKAFRISTAVLFAAAALALVGGSSALPGNGRIVVAHEGALWLANSDGSDPQPLASGMSFFSPVTWSPDGSRLAFGAGAGEAPHVFLIDADGSDLHAVPLGETFRYSPVCWLPDDMLVLLGTVADGSTWDLWLVRTDGSGLHRLTTDGAPKSLSHQPCAADGSKVAYSTGLPFTAYWIPTSGGEPVRLTPEGSADFPPTLSPDGRYAAVARGDHADYISEVSMSRVDLETGATLPLSAATSQDAEALWSPDSTRLVLSARWFLPLGRFPLVVGELSLLAADGSSERTLTRPPARERPFDFSASWSPDGERIVFDQSGAGVGFVQTRVMNPDGTCRTTIAQSPDYSFVAGGWQPAPGLPPARPLECVDVRIDGEADRTLLTMGEAFTLRARVENQGNQPATEVVVDGGEPAYLRPVSISAGSGSCSLERMRCELGTLQPGERVEITLSLRSTHAEPRTGSTLVTYPVQVTAAGDDNPRDNALTTALQAWACTQLASPAGSLVDGTPRADILCGHVGEDRMFGRSGKDMVSARGGNDRVEGGPGRDRIDGGAGWDTLLGGPGGDAFLVRDGFRDVVDCGPGEDQVAADRLDRLRRCEHVRRRA